MIYEIKRIEIGSIVKIVFIISLLFGFFIAFFAFTLISSFSQSLSIAAYETVQPRGPSFAVFAAILCLFGIPIGNTLFAIVICLVYNAVASLVGGARLQLDVKNSTNNDSNQIAG